MPPVGFKPMISAGEQLQTYALDRMATGTGSSRHNRIIMSKKVMYVGRMAFTVCFKELLSEFFTMGNLGKH
jgi:hypothetical protein